MKCYIKDYPRPQFVRRQWMDLNGQWDFAFDDGNQGEKNRWNEGFKPSHIIQVPFVYETSASGIGEEAPHNHIWYQRRIYITDISQTVLLHFEGSDYETKVWVNGYYLGNHFGGYSRFTMEITNELRDGDNEIVVKVSDTLRKEQPRGKQRWEAQSFDCWYVQTTGIWKSVWLEYVPRSAITAVKITPNLEYRSVDLVFDIIGRELKNNLQVRAEVFFNDKLVNSISIPVLSEKVQARMDIHSDHTGHWGVKVWSPWDPALYDISFTLWDGEQCLDTVESYFGMREIGIKDGRVLLNGDPINQRLILDQGYWKDSHLTPPSEVALMEDIQKAQLLGYNGVRKHQKTEDERFLYWCDVKGLLVWSEAPATYVFHDEMVEIFIKEWMDIVKQNYNHPCIVTWVPINESWGVPEIRRDKMQQSFTEAIYHITKAFDPMRPVIVNDGWEHTVSDILTIHDYQPSGDKFYEKYLTKKDLILSNKETHNGGRYLLADGYEYKGQPIIISEYGGIAIHGDDQGWGYGNMAEGKEEFISRFDSITTAIKKIPYISGYCYTQFTDVQQEINGLLTAEREFKVDFNKIKEINDRKFGY